MKLFKAYFFVFNILSMSVMFCPPIQDKSKIVIPPYTNEEWYKKNLDEIFSEPTHFVSPLNGERLAISSTAAATHSTTSVTPAVVASAVVAQAQANKKSAK